MIIDITELPPAVVEQMAKLARGEFAAAATRAIREQKQVADHYHRHRPRSRDGIGGQTMALHPLLHWEAGVYFGDGNWTADRDKVKWYLKQNPAAKVEATGTKTMVGWRNPSGEIHNRRSRTVFPDAN